MQAKSILCKCPSERNAKIKNSHASLVSALLVARIPNSPFCMLAYSTAITVCCSIVMPPIPGWTSNLSISLAVMTLFIVLYNYNDSLALFAGIWANGSFLFIVKLSKSNILKQTRRVSVHG